MAKVEAEMHQRTQRSRRGTSRRSNLLLQLSLVYLVYLAAVAHASNPSTITTATPSAVVSSSSSSGNVVVQLAKYIKNSVTQTIDSCGQCWSNHGTCKGIRKQIQRHREFVSQQLEDQGLLTAEAKEDLKTLTAGITFEEYAFLQKGKEDRGKVLNIIFLMWGAPRFLPYALMLNPDMLPSPFRRKDHGSESIWVKQSRERSSAVLETLMQMEQQCHVTPGLAKLNIFNKNKQERQKEQLTQIVDQTAQFFQSSSYDESPLAGASQVLEKVQKWIYQSGADFGRAEKRLCQVPPCVVKGLANALSEGGGGGLLSGLQPHFMTRGRVVGHIRKVAEADDFLVQSNIDLSTVSKRLLREACSDRFMDGPNLTDEQLRQQLTDWLSLAVHQPASRLEQDVNCYYNGNLARMMLMAYYGCLATRDPQSSSTLPRLLFTGGTLPAGSLSKNEKAEPESLSKRGTGRRKRRFFLSSKEGIE